MTNLMSRSYGLWFFGLSGSGKSFASKYIKKFIKNSFIIDGDIVRKNISFDLDYTKKNRIIAGKRVFGLAKICIEQSFFPIVSTVYFDSNLLKDLNKLKIKLIEIKRDDSLVNLKLKDCKNVVGEDLNQETICCEIIKNDNNFENKLKELLK